MVSESIGAVVAVALFWVERPVEEGAMARVSEAGFNHAGEPRTLEVNLSKCIHNRYGRTQLM